MDDKSLKDLFEQNAAKADETQRAKAVEAALAAFNESPLKINDEATQGFTGTDRPTDNVTEITRRSAMFVITTRPWYTGLAAAAGVMLAVNLVFFQPGVTPPFDETAIPETVVSKLDLNKSPVMVGNVSFDDKDVDQRFTGELLMESLAASDEQAIASNRNEARTLANSKRIAAESHAQEHSTITSAIPSAMPPATLSMQQGAASSRVREPSMPPAPAVNQRDEFTAFADNPVKRVSESPVSTFSVDVDTASYGFVRRLLNRGVLPPSNAVRVEELVNYFDYAYARPNTKNLPFKPTVTVLDSPWKAGNKLVHIGIKGYEMTGAEMPRTNLVFLLDVSGSMNAPDKLPLVKQSLSLLLNQLQADDTVAIAVYAGAAGTVLPPTPAAEKQTILDAMQRLSAGGSTAGGAGIKLAYQLAQSAFIKDGVNRVILATDGDFNVGITNNDELQDFVERQRDSGIFLSILGFGEGNYQDARMQALAQNGNGVASYIDTLAEAQKVLVEEATSTLFTIAKDVKIQLEFNPATVSEYRLIGYETRALKREDFRNDAVDAGDIGAGHTVTAIYEIVPAGSGNALIPPSRYEADISKSNSGSEYGMLKIRYKQPDSDTSELIELSILQAQDATPLQLNEAQFGVSVAGFSQLLRGGTYTGDWALNDALTLALANRGEDTYGYRSEFTQLVRKAISANDMR
jgi:Ca-activated chloride channel family protein